MAYLSLIQLGTSTYDISASKLKTARTISLTGSVTGSGSFDGSGNLSIATTTNHTHDDTYVNVSGDTMTGNLFIKGSNPYLGFKNSSGTVSGYIQFIESNNTYAIGNGVAKSLVITNTGSITIPASQTFTPVTTNTGSIGTNDAKWNAMYATTFIGKLDGNATSATTASKLKGGAKLTSETIDGFLEEGLVKWATADASAVGNNDGIIMSFGWSSTYGALIWLDDGSGEGGMKIRNRTASAWNPWRQVLTEYNYNDYSPTLTGTGATGTWKISITGSAASVSSKFSANTSKYNQVITWYDADGTTQHSYIGAHNTGNSTGAIIINPVKDSTKDNWANSLGLYIGKTVLKFWGTDVSLSTHTHDYLPKNPGSIEMFPGTSAGHGGYIDFHYNSNSADYTSRIIESGSGKITINGSNFTSTGVSMAPGNVTMTNGNLNISRSTTIAANEAARINFTITLTDNNVSSTSYIAVFDDLDTAGNGNNMVICSKSGVYVAAGEGAGNYLATNPSTSELVHICADSTIYFHTNCNTVANATSSVYINSSGKLYGAVWNDYAEFRTQKEIIEPGYCVASSNNGQVYKTTEKFQACDGIVSDTFGFAIGETDECKTPLAVAGRVLAYCFGNRDDYQAGDTVCAGPEGKVMKMTREEIKEYPDRIIGIVSEIPEYEIWGSGNVKVNNRIWIKVK